MEVRQGLANVDTGERRAFHWQPLGDGGILVAVAVYLAWAGGAFAIVYSDLQRHPRFAGATRAEGAAAWGMLEWGLVSVLAGGLALPFYFSITRGSSGLVRGIGLGIAVAVFALCVRIGLSVVLRVPIL